MAIGVTVVATVTVSAWPWPALSLLRTARQLRDLAEDLDHHTAVVLGGVEVAMARAQGELDRVDDLVGSAQAITAAVGGPPGWPGWRSPARSSRSWPSGPERPERAGGCSGGWDDGRAGGMMVRRAS